MVRIEDMLSAKQYSIVSDEKNQMLLSEFNDLTRFHYGRCGEYASIINRLFAGRTEYDSLQEIPFLPVRLFKLLDLKSIPQENVVRLLKSSGTTDAGFSKIYLDRETSVMQTKTLASIVTSFIGPKRLPMIIVDSESSVNTSSGMSARGAGLVGLSNFGRDHFYLLDENFQIRFPEFQDFLERHRNEPLLIFGFTFMVWKFFYQEIVSRGIKVNLDGSTLIHSGGWKKLADQAVSNDKFKKCIRDETGITNIHNFYGMVEQVGSVFMECEHGFFHCANFSEVIARDFRTFAPISNGQEGILQTMSIIPRSYPGHSILTEDLGVVHGTDGCPCGRKGTYFSVSGRIPQAELRGCSDVYNH